MIHSSILETIGDTPLIRLNRVFADHPGVTVLAKLESANPGGSGKDRVARQMIAAAEAAGTLRPGDTLVEPTTGNTGLGLALIAAVRGYRLIIVMTTKISREKQQLLRAYGAEVMVMPAGLPPDHPDHYIAVAKRLAAERPRTFLLDQFANPGNPAAHAAGTGPEIWRQAGGRIDLFVTGVGTGGTVSGAGRYLKELNPALEIIGICPEGSLYAGGAPKPYRLEGIGLNFYPETFDRAVPDRLIAVNDEDSYREVRRLAREEGILAGDTTGAVLTGLRRRLSESGDLSGRVAVMMVHDTGRNYISKFYNDDWLAAEGLPLTGDTA